MCGEGEARGAGRGEGRERDRQKHGIISERSGLIQGVIVSLRTLTRFFMPTPFLCIGSSGW